MANGPASGFSVDQWLSGSVPAAPAASSAPAKGPAAGKSVEDWLRGATPPSKPTGLAGKAAGFGEKLGADFRDFADMFLGAPASAAKALIESGVEAYKHDPKAGLKVGQEMANNPLFGPWLHPLKSFQAGVTGQAASDSELNYLSNKVLGTVEKHVAAQAKKSGIPEAETQILVDDVMSGLGLTGLHAIGKFGAGIATKLSAEAPKPPEPVEETAPPEPPQAPPSTRNDPAAFQSWVEQQHQAAVDDALHRHAQDILDGKVGKTAAEKAMRKSPKLVAKLQELSGRRGDARAAFDQEPAPPEEVAKTRLAEGLQIGGKELQPADHPQIEVPGAESTLDSAVRKVRAGQRFAMTPEERIAWNALSKGEQRIAVEQGAKARGPRERLPRFPEEAPKGRLAEGTVIGQGEPTPADRLITPDSPTALDSAVAKVKQGRTFDMTDAERMAWNAAQRAKGQIEQPSWYRTKKIGGKQFGGFDPEEAGKMLGRGVAVAGMALGRLMQDEPYTSKTLERLPQGKDSFTVDQVKQQLNRADVTGPEKDAFNTTLELFGKDGKISAPDLVKGFKLATGDYHLKPEETREFADYGLERVRPYNVPVTPEEYFAGVETPENMGEQLPSTTTKYKLPFDIPQTNHFGDDPRLFGWTRSFMEGGKRHVVEIQSDVAQKGALDIGDEQRQVLRDKIATAEARLENFKADYAGMREALGDRDPQVRGLKNAVDVLTTQIAEMRNKAAPVPDKERVAGTFKHWERRLVQEELARAQGAPVRFATPDTVAKVEGWPEMYSPDTRVDLNEFVKHRVAEFRRENARDPKLEEKARTAEANWKKAAEQGHYFKSAGHAGLYVRYAENVSRYLKSLGGKEVTDEQGHSWIEVPTRAGAKARMYGRVDPQALKALGIAAGGALLFHYLDPEDKWKAYATGAALALTGAWLAPRIREGLKTDMRLRIDRYADDFEAAKQVAAVRLHGLVQGVRKAVPDASRRVAISHWLEDQRIPLSPTELKVARSVQTFFANAATELQKHGLLKEARDNYVTHLWDHRVNQQRFGGSLRTTTPFTKARTFTTLAEGKAAGLVPATEDIADIVQQYGDSTNNAMAGKEFMETLKGVPAYKGGKEGPPRPGKPGLKTPDGKPLVARAEDAPKGYVPVDLPQFRGLLVHPDIAPSLRMFESPNLGVPFQQVSEAMQALKRVKVVGSLFHVKTLAEVAVGGREFSKILSTPGRLATFALGRDAMLKDLNAGGLAPDVEALVRGGINISLERSTPGVEDIGGSFYQGMDELQKWLDQHASPLGKVNKAFTEINHKLDTLTWARVQTGLKLMIGSEALHRLELNGVPREEAAKIAANYTNTLWGGLNWRRIAEGARSRLGRDVAMAMLHPRARSVTQILLFAPDWTVSTIRQITQAVRRSGGPAAQIKGLFKPTELADLHRLALLRSAVYYFTVGNALNQLFSGHNIWQNKNPLRVDLGNGRTMQFSKHLTEPLEWLQQPAKTAAGKLSYAVTEPINQLTGKEYIGGPPMQESRLVHAAQGVLPFPATAGSPERALAGMAGFPIYGHTAAEKRSIAYERYRREHTAEAYRKRYKKRLEELGE